MPEIPIKPFDRLLTDIIFILKTHGRFVMELLSNCYEATLSIKAYSSHFERSKLAQNKQAPAFVEFMFQRQKRYINKYVKINT